MAQEDVDRTKAAYQAFTGGDLEGALEGFADDAEWWSSEDVPPGGSVRGKDEILKSWSQIPEHWSEFAPEPEEFIDAGDKVIVLGKLRATAKETGNSAEARYVHVVWNRGGQVVRGEFHSDSAKEVRALNG